jgi:RNA polymerase sigma-70 factor (ECF subfamily)
LAYRYASNPSDAEDIAQEALLCAWRRRATLREGTKRNHWLATIVRNEASHQRARRPGPSAALEELDGAEDVRVIATVERADLRAALRGLSERDRQLLALRYREDLSQAAIARRLGIPESTVKVRLHRARARLRRAYVPL